MKGASGRGDGDSQNKTSQKLFFPPFFSPLQHRTVMMSSRMKPPGLVLIGQREAEIGKSNKNKRKKKRKFGVAEKAAEKEKKDPVSTADISDASLFSGAKQGEK